VFACPKAAARGGMHADAVEHVPDVGEGIHLESFVCVDGPAEGGRCSPAVVAPEE